MDTEVSNGHYDEALELIEFARKLGKVTKLLQGQKDQRDVSNFVLL